MSAVFVSSAVTTVMFVSSTVTVAVVTSRDNGTALFSNWLYNGQTIAVRSDNLYQVLDNLFVIGVHQDVWMVLAVS